MIRYTHRNKLNVVTQTVYSIGKQRRLSIWAKLVTAPESSPAGERIAVQHL